MDNVNQFSLVVGVDRKHLKELRLSWPTWMKHHPILQDIPKILFYDRHSLEFSDVSFYLDALEKDTSEHRTAIYAWPPPGIEYPGTPGDKWTDPQRHKMLAGFVYIAAKYVKTQYWLKLDTDAIAQPSSMPWPAADWLGFGSPHAIIAQGWGITKPADQMQQLDDWVDRCQRLDKDFKYVALADPLQLHPEPGATKLRHQRIISWCGFFDTEFTQWCADLARISCGYGLLPVCSQDGFMWYIAQRVGLGVHRVNMKQYGWEHWGTFSNLQKRAEHSLLGA